MKTRNILLMSSFVLSPSVFAVPDPGPLSAVSSNATGCTTNPADSTSYRCYNPEWANVPKIKEHLNYALVLGNHDGSTGSRGNSGGGQTEKHCTEDILFNNVEAANRTLWSLKCRYVDFVKVKNYLYTLDRFDNPVIQPIVWYPLFGRDTGMGNYQVYRLGDRAMDYRTRSCDLPAEEKLIHWCEAGCFAADQLLPYMVEDVQYVDEFKNLPRDRSITVQALTPESGLDHLQLEPTQAQIVYHAEDDVVGGEIFEIHVKDQNQAALRVTANHPLINADGELVMPVDLMPGQQLLSTEGPREVSRVERVPYEGDIFNVLPESKELRRNILVMEGGFLVGSQRIQNREYGYAKRLFYRETVEVD